LINFKILFLFQRYRNVSIISRFYFSFRHKCSSIRNSNFIFTVLFRYRKQRLTVDVSLFLRSKSVRNSKQININSWISNSSSQQWTTTESFSRSSCWFSIRTIFICESKNWKI
jgi:hypothetical protein